MLESVEAQARSAARDVTSGSREADERPVLQGSCHGFQVFSDLPLELVRAPAPGQPALVVDQSAEPLPEPAGPPLRRWVPGPGRPFSGSLHRLDGGYGVWMDGLGAYRVETGTPRISVPAGVTTAQAETRLWGTPTTLCFLSAGDLPIHAAAIRVGDSALLLTGPGRFGKTTLAAAFLQAGYGVLNEDLSRCVVGPRPTVYPGPALLRVRRDAYARLGELPDTSVVYEDDERVHFSLGSTVRGDGAPVPIRGIVTLRVWDRPTQLERLEAAEALPLLWAVNFKFHDDHDRARCFLGVSALFDKVPVWRLGRRLEYDGLDRLVDRLVTTCLP